MRSRGLRGFITSDIAAAQELAEVSSPLSFKRGEAKMKLSRCRVSGVKKNLAWDPWVGSQSYSNCHVFPLTPSSPQRVLES